MTETAQERVESWASKRLVEYLTEAGHHIVNGGSVDALDGHVVIEAARRLRARQRDHD